MALLDKNMEILNSKLEKRTEADEDIFGKMVSVTLKQMNLNKKLSQVKR